MVEGEKGPGLSGEDFQEIPADVSVELMNSAMEYYTKHRDVVFRKMEHAQTATSLSMREIEQASGTHESSARPDEYRTAENYESLWVTIMEMFRNKYIPESALKKIENILSSLPRMIMKYYDILISQDHSLGEMIAELASDKFRGALQVIAKIQKGPCPLAGLVPEDELRGGVFKFNVGRRPKTAH